MNGPQFSSFCDPPPPRADSCAAWSPKGATQESPGRKPWEKAEQLKKALKGRSNLSASPLQGFLQSRP